ncbi:hypothetical protein [Jiangella asiatica]|uniref:Tetrapyrrole biosynthesis glutamyl-tRNA reductase dimerisation domain-containing protein n=1 Tax=Jiangella asiatica TaxID=2530372 RepID=A0A4R5D6Z5_9ACTN|nr:hypothetical protein [Jiangella asiatica]TDE09249.1 hypothetical protein E1269_14585 [Jiangella asiatica]
MDAAIRDRDSRRGAAEAEASSIMVTDTTALAAEMRYRSAVVISAELRRLAGRARGLSETDLDILETALTDLAERLILAPLRACPYRADQFRRLFDVAEAGP